MGASLWVVVKLASQDRTMFTEASKLAPTRTSRSQKFILQILQRSLITAQQRPTENARSIKPISELRLLRREGAPSIDSHALLRMLRSSGAGGISMHSLILKLGFQSVIFLQTALVSMYSDSRKLKDARQMFDEISNMTLVCWTAMMSGYVNNQRPDKALDLFRQMQMEGTEPDQITLTICLSACADLGALDVGRWIHTYIRRNPREDIDIDIDIDIILGNALINMYAKCGDIVAARGLFESAEQRDVTTWTSMILCYAMHGEAREALRLFDGMKSGSITPNGVTFIGVLTACSHAGLVEEGRRHWESMRRVHRLRPQIGHYGCVVDLLCRAGLLEEARAFIKRMPMKPNAVIWRTLLSACGVHGNVGLGVLARRRLLELEPGYAGDYVAMSNVYAAEGLWGAKQWERQRMRQRRVPGCSLIEVGDGVHEFSAGDRRNLKKREIKTVLDGLVCNFEAPLSSSMGIGLNTDEYPLS